jgi:hypothetical protein
MASTKADNLLGFTLYKGDLHAHPRGHCPDPAEPGTLEQFPPETFNKDCWHEPAPRRPAAEVFHMAKMTGADFFASTDHDASEGGFIFWGKEDADPIGATLFDAWKGCLLMPFDIPAVNNDVADVPWLFADDAIDAHSAAEVETDQAFVGIAGYELTHGHQHMNIFDMVEWVHPGDLFCGLYKGTIADRMNNLAWLIQHGRTPIVQFNHAGADLFNGFAFHPGVVNNAHLMEIQHDSLASFDAMLGGFRRALSQGWKLSPTATSDRHFWYESIDFPGDFRQFEQRTGIALPVGTPLTRANLFHAIRQRRTFSSSNKHLAAMYTANDMPMGSVLTGSSSVPIDFHFMASETSPDRTNPEAKNICAVELWSSGTASNLVNNTAPLVVWTNPSGGATFTFTHRLWLPYFKDYFFIVNAARTCNAQNPRFFESRLVTAPVWTAAQHPKPTASAPSEVIAGNSFVVQWSAPWVGTVRLQAYKRNSANVLEPFWQSNPVPNNSQPNGQYTLSTATWSPGHYRIGVVDLAYPGYEWTTQNIRVENPPPEEPPEECKPGRLCN